jgi:hypothetical protein
MCITQEGPANALALNKDYSQVVIAGRNGNTFVIICSSIITYKRARVSLHEISGSRGGEYEDDGLLGCCTV